MNMKKFELTEEQARQIKKILKDKTNVGDEYEIEENRRA